MFKGSEKQIAWAQDIVASGYKAIEIGYKNVALDLERHLINQAEADRQNQAWDMTKASFDKVFDESKEINAADVIENRVRYNADGVENAFRKAYTRVNRMSRM